MNFTAYIQKDAESGMYVGIVPALPGAHTQAKTLDELNANLKEVIELCMEDLDEEETKLLPTFAGISQIEVSP